MVDREDEQRERTILDGAGELMEGVGRGESRRDAEHGRTLTGLIAERVAALRRIAAIVAVPRRSLRRGGAAMAGSVSRHGLHRRRGLFRVTRMGPGAQPEGDSGQQNEYGGRPSRAHALDRPGSGTGPEAYRVASLVPTAVPPVFSPSEMSDPISDSPAAARPERLSRYAGPALALAILGLQAATIHWQSLSGDEAQHLLAGQHALVYGQNLHNLEHPPLVKLVAALPVLASGTALAPPMLPSEAVAASDHMHRQPEKVWRAAVAGRWAVLLAFGAPLLIACFFLGRRFGGTIAGWLLVAMVGLSFNLVPWLSSLQTDAAVACGFVATLLAGLRWQEKPSPGRAAAIGAGVGLAAASKFSGLFLLPIVLLLAVAPAQGRVGWRRRVALPLVALPIAAALVLATYAIANRRYQAETGREVIRQYCRGEATLLTGDRLVPWEERLLALERRHPLVGQLATGGIGIAEQNALGVYPSYAFGEVSSRGRWWYFPAALLVKTPLVLLAAAVALALRWRPRHDGAIGMKQGSPILAATVLLYLAMAMRSNYNIGLRHLLPVLPLLYLPLAVGLARRPRWGAAIAVTLLVEAIVVAPNWLAATNTWWLGERNPTRFALGDVEFRQNLRWLDSEARRRGLKPLGVLYLGLRDDVLRAYLPTARLVGAEDPLPPGWYVVNVAVEQLVPGILNGDPRRIYRYPERRAIAAHWQPVWRYIRSGEDHGWIAGTFHLYRLPRSIAVPFRHDRRRSDRSRQGA